MVNWRKEWKKEVKQFTTEQLMDILNNAHDYNHLYIEIVEEELESRPDFNRISWEK